jgi:hypothetical protein
MARKGSTYYILTKRLVDGSKNQAEAKSGDFKVRMDYKDVGDHLKLFFYHAGKLIAEYELKGHVQAGESTQGTLSYEKQVPSSSAQKRITMVGKALKKLEYPINNRKIVEKMKDGGTLGLGKSEAEKVFHLPYESAVYVPSTQDVDQVISIDEMEARTNEVKEYLANLFGGYTSSETVGGFVDSKGDLVNEEVVKVTSFSNKNDFEKHKEKLLKKLAEWGRKWGQEAIGYEYEGDLYYIPDNFKDGGVVRFVDSGSDRAFVTYRDVKTGVQYEKKFEAKSAEQSLNKAESFAQKLPEGTNMTIWYPTGVMMAEGGKVAIKRFDTRGLAEEYVSIYKRVSPNTKLEIEKVSDSYVVSQHKDSYADGGHVAQLGGVSVADVAVSKPIVLKDGGSTDKNWIQDAEKKMKKKGTVGAFTKQAERAGMSTTDFAKKVLANKENYTQTTVDRAQFMKNTNPELFMEGGHVAQLGGTSVADVVVSKPIVLRDGGSLDDYYKKMEEKIGKKQSFIRILKDSSFSTHKGMRPNEFKHNRLNQTALAEDDKVTLVTFATAYEPSRTEVFKSVKKLGERLYKYQDGGSTATRSMSVEGFKYPVMTEGMYKGGEYEILGISKKGNFYRIGEVGDIFGESDMIDVPREELENNFTPFMRDGGEINSVVSNLKKGDKITIEFGSAVSKDNKVTLQVRSRNKVRKGTIDKITFVNQNNPKGVKYYAYDRGDGKWGFAKGDMGISNVQVVKTFRDGGQLPQKIIDGVEYKVIKDGSKYNVGVYPSKGSAWKVGNPISKSEAIKLLNTLGKKKPDGGQLDKNEISLKASRMVKDYYKSLGGDNRLVFQTDTYRQGFREVELLLHDGKDELARQHAEEIGAKLFEMEDMYKDGGSTYSNGGQIKFGSFMKSGNFDVTLPNGKTFEIEVDRNDGSPKFAIEQGDDHRGSWKRQELSDYQDEIYSYAMGRSTKEWQESKGGSTYSNGGKVKEGVFVVYGEDKDGKYKLISTHKSMKSANAKLDKEWEKGEYDNMGAINSKEWNQFYAPHSYAKGGATEHGLKRGDKITDDLFWDKKVIVENKGKKSEVDLEKGTRKKLFANGGNINDEVSIEELTEVIGHDPNYPYQQYEGYTLTKCFRRPYYKIVKID